MSQVADESGWPHGIVGYADVTVDDVRPQLDRLTKYPTDARRAHAAALARERDLSLRRAARSCDRPEGPAQRRASRRLRLELRPAGVRAADGGRRAACRRVPEGDVRAAARRHAGGSLGQRLGRMARRHDGCSPRSRMSCRRPPRSAPSSTATIRRISPRSRARPSRSSARSARCSARTFRSRSSGPRTRS